MEAPLENALPLVPVPPQLLWDYPVAPPDPLWRLNRIATRFPALGTDRQTVSALFQALPWLKAPLETRVLIELYEEQWQRRLATSTPKR